MVASLTESGAKVGHHSRKATSRKRKLKEFAGIAQLDRVPCLTAWMLLVQIQPPATKIVVNAQADALKT